MRALIAAPLLGLSLLGGCAEPQYLLSERTDSAPLATTSDLREVPARYTNHAPGTATTQVVNLRIDAAFTDEERAKILSAAREWNHVLNGAVRFDVTSESGVWGWTIVPSRKPVLPEDWRTPQPLVAHLRVDDKGGFIIVYVTRLKDPMLQGGLNHDLRGLMVHELGMALGGGNGSSLMTARMQDCVDKNMAMSVGAIHNIPTAQLNWCETGATVANR